jgi:hypothetical protein
MQIMKTIELLNMSSTGNLAHLSARPKKNNQLILLGLPASCPTGSNPKYIIEVFFIKK